MKKRPWLIASAFVWCLAGAVAIATYSGRPPATVAEPEHDHASHAGQPHVDEPATSPAETAATSSGLTAPGVTAADPSSAQPDNAMAPREIKWEETFEGAMQLARTQKKPILIDFYADWCGPCKDMDARVYPDRQVIAQSQNWVTVKVNGDKRPDVMQAYGLSAYPTLVFAESSGKPVKVIEGYHDAPQLVAQMQEAFSTWSSTRNAA